MELKRGLSRRHACQVLGVTYTGFYTHLKNLAERNPPKSKDWELKMQQAEAFTTSIAVDRITKSIFSKDAKLATKAAQDYLNIKRPQEWSPTKKVDLTGDMSITSLPDSIRKEMQGQIRRVINLCHNETL